MTQYPLKHAAVVPLLTLFVFFLAPITMAVATSPDIETKISPKTIRAGESFSLQIELRGSLIQAEPDLTPLETTFEILEVNQSQRQSYVNGAYDASSNWQITLVPKITGDLQIPALSVGPASTETESILVSGARPTANPLARSTSPGAAAPGTVAVQVSVERLDPYEQERVILHLRLYAGEDLIEGSLAEPEIPGATIERLGEDQPFEEEIRGHLYQGVERVYAILPERAGELVIPPISFDGLIHDNRVRRGRRGHGGFSRRSMLDDFFGSSGFGGDLFDRVMNRERRRVVARSRPLTLHVRPRPAASAGSWWLPTRDLSLDEKWDPTPDRVRVGEALTRRITLRARGASALQLPPLTLPEVSGVKQYTEAPETAETESGTVRVQNATIIPTQEGSLTLPAIQVTWWDTQADEPRIASLPARTLEILPAISGTTIQKPPIAHPASASLPTPELAAASQTDPRPFASHLWPWVALTLGILGTGGGIWAWRNKRGQGGHRNRVAEPPPRRSLRQAERALRNACRRSDPHAAELALREIGRIRDPHAQRPDIGQQASEFGSEALQNEIARLKAVQYSSTKQEWQGKGLWNAYHLARKRIRKTSQTNPGGGLPPLYPDASSGGNAHGVA